MTDKEILEDIKRRLEMRKSQLKQLDTEFGRGLYANTLWTISWIEILEKGFED